MAKHHIVRNASTTRTDEEIVILTFQPQSCMDFDVKLKGFLTVVLADAPLPLLWGGCLHGPRTSNARGCASSSYTRCRSLPVQNDNQQREQFITKTTVSPGLLPF